MFKTTHFSRHVIEFLLAAIVLLIALITFTNLPQPYPTWPTIGAIPIDPELIIPALLGLAVLLRTIADGLSIGSVVIGVLSIITLLIATMSMYALYTAETGGVFWGGFFTLISGVILAIAAIIQSAVRWSVHRGVPNHVRNRFGN